MTVDFYFIGPSKTASTWLYKALDEHPDFSLPKAKDIYYFDQFYHKGDSWYFDQFNDCDERKVIGEFSHDYILSSVALNRIKKFNPDVKILLCIRNPYDRTESGIKFLQRNGYGFDELQVLLRRHTELLEGSLYGKNVKRVYSVFNKNNVLILNYDKLLKNPTKFLEDIYQFFNVASFESEIVNRRVNKAKSARFILLSYFVKRTAIIARRVGFGRLVGALKMNPFVNRIFYKESNSQFRLSEADRRFLQSVFRDDIKLLEAITGMNFDGWR